MSMTQFAKEVTLPAILAFAICALLGRVLLPLLQRLKVRQTVREEGPKSHLKKNGTPTMGGLFFLAALFAVSCFYLKSYPLIFPILFLTLGFGLIGFLDDYIKVVLKRSMGLRVWQKLLGQVIVTAIFAYSLTHIAGVDLAMKIPFAPGKYLDLGVFAVPALFFIVIGTVNGTNFTDGLDGLAGSVTAAVAVFLTVAALGTGVGISPLTSAMAGALLGFLIYNVHPASVFMGDTGSLALGGFVAGTAYVLKLPLFLPIVGFIYMIEVLSVILQVVYFKLTHGKRIFRMAPLHHHFELGGWSEAKVAAVFTAATILLCLIAITGLW